MRSVDFDAPMPLGYHQAIQRALELRNEHPPVSYPALALVFARYHGVRQSASWWREHLVLAGAETRPRGVPFERAA